MPPKRALDVAGAPRRELANEIETLCSDFEIRVGGLPTSQPPRPTESA